MKTALLQSGDEMKGETKMFRGIVPIIAAPFQKDGSLDLISLKAELKYLKEAGCTGATLFGIAGEYYKLSDAECEEMMEITAQECKQLDLVCVISCTAQSTETAIKRARRIEEVGADCMMLLPPFLMKPYSSELMRHIREVCSAVSIPVMLQYAPAQTGVPISPEMMCALANEISNLQYFKIECKPAGPYITSFLSKVKKEAAVFNGNAGYQMIEAFDRGAVGCMPGASMAKLYVNIFETYFSGDKEKAILLHNQLLPMLNHIRQDVDMIIHYEKKILARKGVLATDYCRHPEYVTDEETESLFEIYYQMIRPLI